MTEITSEAAFDLTPAGVGPAPVVALVDRLRHVTKRALDVVFAAVAIVLCVPAVLAIACAIKVTSPGPVLYRHRRVGRGGRLFTCWKFRTMVVDADDELKNLLRMPEHRAEFERDYKLRGDPRVTPLGRLLRTTSLDELPQFWNVLRGDMSVVGPRPLVVEETPRYGSAIDTVLRVRPGITGIWQVSGRNDIPYPVRVDMDAEYAERPSIRRDLWIMARTFAALIPRRNGAY